MTGDERGFVSLVVVIELYWVLTSVFGLQRGQFVTALESLLRVREIAIERAETVAQTLRMFARSNADFADCLIERTAAAAGCERTITFDRGASKNCGMVLLD